MTALSEAEFRCLLAAKGLLLDDKAVAAALQGARHLQGEVARVAAYLIEQQDKYA